MGYLPQKIQLPRHFIYLNRSAEHFLPASQNEGNDFFKILGVKFWYDGSPYAGSMYMDGEYCETSITKKLHIRSGDLDKPLIEKAKLVEDIVYFTKKHQQILIHTQGDTAIRETLDAFDQANKLIPLANLRHRLEHCLLLEPTLLPKMIELNVSPSFHINHIYYYGDALPYIIGDYRTDKILPVNSVATCAMNFSLHSDQPMFASDALSLVATATTRETKTGSTINMAEGISVYSALKAVTIMAAWHLGMENKIGSISVGKYADFVVIDQNPFMLSPQYLRTINILRTFVADKEIDIK